MCDLSHSPTTFWWYPRLDPAGPARAAANPGCLAAAIGEALRRKAELADRSVDCMTVCYVCVYVLFAVLLRCE